MRLGLRMGLNSRQGGGSALDPDALLYIAAVETALGTPIATALPSATSNPKRIISDFIKAEKASSRWALHKRIFLPIYNNASASAIDMVSRLPGTFQGLSGSVTHAAGYVQGDGASGYFSFGSTDTTLGLTTSSGCLISLLKSADTRTDARTMMGVASGANAIYHEEQTSTVVRMIHGNSTLGEGQHQATLSPRSTQCGIFTSSFDGSTRRFRLRKNSGVTVLADAAGVVSGTLPNQIMVSMALNSIGTIVRHSNAEFGFFGISLIGSSLDHDGFSLNLKTLWESLTGLTLP